MFCVNTVNAEALTEVSPEKDRFEELCGIFSTGVAELVSCKSTALTGAPCEGFCHAFYFKIILSHFFRLLTVKDLC